MLKANRSQSELGFYAWLSLIVMAFVILMQMRVTFAFGTPSGLRFILLALTATALLGVVMLFMRLRQPYPPLVRSWILRSWPLLALFAIDLAYLAFSFITRRDPTLNGVLRVTPALNIALSMAAAPAAYLIGVLNRDIGAKRIAWFLTLVTGLAFLVGLIQYADGLGYQNFISRSLTAWQDAYAARYPMFNLDEYAVLRIQGFETWPFFYAYPAAIAIAWALAGSNHIVLRIMTLLSSLGMVMMSGTRAVMLAVAATFVAWAVTGIASAGWRKWLHGNRVLVAVLAAGVLVLAIAAIASPGQSEGIGGRIAETTDAIAENPSPDEAVEALVSSSLNGREIIWARATELLRDHPLGTGHPFGFHAGGHTHSDILERLTWGGPLMLIAYIGTMLWIIAVVKTPSSPKFGLLVGLAMFTAGLTDLATLLQFLGAPAFFLLGVLVDHDWIDGIAGDARADRHPRPLAVLHAPLNPAHREESQGRPA